MKATIAIDPGTCSGLAVFADGVLALAWGGGVEELIPQPAGFQMPNQAELVIEIPQIYPGVREEDPNDLIKVAEIAGRWIERLRLVQVTRVNPREWKGQVPKKIHNERVIAKLTSAEVARLPSFSKSKQHNVIDAVGLGLWRLGRMGRGA